MHSLRALLLSLLLVPPLFAQSLSEARKLADEGQVAHARATLEAILDAATAETERAEALLLLGELLVAEARYAAALPHWRELAARHPGSDQAARVGPRLALLEALVECHGGGPAAAPPATPPGADSAVAASPAEGAPAGSPPAPTAPRAEAVPGPGAVPAGQLLVGAYGVPYDASQETAAAILEFLTESGVAAGAATTEIPAIRGSDAVLAFLLEEVAERRAAGLLFVTTRFGFREYVRVERFDAAGRRLWGERVTGGTALREGHDRDSMNRALVERMLERLERRLGGPELPVRR